MLIQRITTVLFMCTVMATGAQAGGGNNSHIGGVDKLAKKLNLSAEQTEQLKALKAEKRNQNKSTMTDRRALKDKGIALLDNYSSAAANSLANEAAEMAKTTTLARLEHMQYIYNILNTQQKQKFKAMLETDHSKGKKRK